MNAERPWCRTLTPLSPHPHHSGPCGPPRPRDPVNVAHHEGFRLDLLQLRFQRAEPSLEPRGVPLQRPRNGAITEVGRRKLGGLREKERKDFIW